MRGRALVTAAALAAVLLWDAAGLDVAVAELFGDANGFPLRDNAFLEAVMHRGARNASFALLAALVIGIWWPYGFLRQLTFAERLQLVIGPLAGLLLVTVLKARSLTSCPWDMATFGGTALHIPYWHLGVPDGGGGHCFPAGHASAGFIFVGAWFVLERRLPALARRWLVAALVAGIVLGFSQQVRGAHFTSHTLWTAWLCWTAAWGVDLAFRRHALRTAAA